MSVSLTLAHMKVVRPSTSPLVRSKSFYHVQRMVLELCSGAFMHQPMWAVFLYKYDHLGRRMPIDDDPTRTLITNETEARRLHDNLAAKYSAIEESMQ